MPLGNGSRKGVDFSELLQPSIQHPVQLSHERVPTSSGETAPLRTNSVECAGNATVAAADCREIAVECDVWITDPPYADAVNYHELSEFFLAWYEKALSDAVPGLVRRQQTRSRGTRRRR